MEDLFIAGILLVFVGEAVLFLWKERRKGAGCIGCPSAGHCPGRASDQEKKDCGCTNKRYINNKTK